MPVMKQEEEKGGGLQLLASQRALLRTTRMALALVTAHLSLCLQLLSDSLDACSAQSCMPS